MTSSNITLATTDEIKNWDKLLTTNPDGGEILQTTAMAEIKKIQGWTPEYWVYETSFGKVYATVLTRRLRGYGKFAYIIRGPGVVSWEQFDEIIELNKSRKEFFTIKLEPPVLTYSDTTPSIEQHTDIKKVHTIQPNANTIIVDLSQSEEDILAGFRQNARREIRQAIKDGVTIKQVRPTSTNMRIMYSLYEQTGKRAGFFTRPYKYYYRYWKIFSQSNKGELYFAYQKGNDQPIAGAFICTFAKKALYKDGGSRRTSSKHFSHLLQWEIMKSLKSEGIVSYDLHGIPPPDQIDNPNHKLHGLYTFKNSFSRDSQNYVGTFDQILNQRTYDRWIKHGQKIYGALLHHVKKTTFY